MWLCCPLGGKTQTPNSPIGLFSAITVRWITAATIVLRHYKKKNTKSSVLKDYINAAVETASYESMLG